LGVLGASGSMRSPPAPTGAFVGRAAVRPATASALRMVASTEPSTSAGRVAALSEGYEVCRKITASYAKTFYLGTRFMEPAQARAIWAVYAWCRRTDDIVDAPRGGIKYLKREIATWSDRLERIWEGEAFDVVDLPLVETVKAYPDMAIQPYKDMIEGMLMDLKQDRYETFEEVRCAPFKSARRSAPRRALASRGRAMRATQMRSCGLGLCASGNHLPPTSLVSAPCSAYVHRHDVCTYAPHATPPPCSPCALFAPAATFCASLAALRVLLPCRRHRRSHDAARDGHCARRHL
jgi:hypothetical protein